MHLALQAAARVLPLRGFLKLSGSKKKKRISKGSSSFESAGSSLLSFILRDQQEEIEVMARHEI